MQKCYSGDRRGVVARVCFFVAYARQLQFVLTTDDCRQETLLAHQHSLFARALFASCCVCEQCGQRRQVEHSLQQQNEEEVLSVVCWRCAEVSSISEHCVALPTCRRFSLSVNVALHTLAAKKRSLQCMCFCLAAPARCLRLAYALSLHFGVQSRRVLRSSIHR